MENLIYILFVSIFVPILLMACLIEKKARQPIIFVLIGIFVSVFAAEINGTTAVIYCPRDLAAGWEQAPAPYAIGYEAADATVKKTLAVACDPALKAAYDQGYAVYRKLYPALKGILA